MKQFSMLGMLLACAVSASRTQTGPDSAGVDQDSIITYSIDEVVITGTRTERRLIDVPFSVERIDQVDYRFEKKTSVSDVLGAVPGLFMQSRYGNHDVRISIRGFGSRSNSGIRGVRILLDGIPESEPDGQTRIEAIDFQSLGSIEIVKGNSSSLYTNAPGGVINFMSDIRFPENHLISFNEFGSYSLHRNGIKAGFRGDDYSLLSTYTYHNYLGYREHSQDFWHIFNATVEANPGSMSRLGLYAYVVDGLIRLPGSLTREQFDADPFQPNQRDVDRDTKRITTKGRIAARFSSLFGQTRDHEIEATAYATIKYFERTTSTYRIINRDGIGGTGRYVHHGSVFGRKNEFSAGFDLFYQYGPVQTYQNIGGKKSDILTALTDEDISNVGFYLQDAFSIINEQFDLLLTGRYDKVVFDQKNQILEVQNATARYEKFTPKAALNYKVTPSVALFTSYGAGFDTPAGNELENFPTSSDPTALINPDLKAQNSLNFEVGTKGTVTRDDAFLPRTYFEATFFSSTIENEIVPFDVFGDVYYRNAASTERKGIELGLDARVIGGLRLKGAYTFSDFVYESYIAQTIGFDTTGNIVTSESDFGGNLLPSIPRHNASLHLSYEHAAGEHSTLFAKLSYLHIDGMFADDANLARTNAYSVLNTTLGSELIFGKLDILLSVGVNNILDHQYVGFVNINSTSGEFYELGEPRTYFGSFQLGLKL